MTASLFGPKPQQPRPQPKPRQPKPKSTKPKKRAMAAVRSWIQAVGDGYGKWQGRPAGIVPSNAHLTPEEVQDVAARWQREALTRAGLLDWSKVTVLPDEPAGFTVQPSNDWSRRLDKDITAYQRTDVAKLRTRLDADTTQPIAAVVAPVIGRHEDRDEHGRELRANVADHAGDYQPRHEKSERTGKKVDLADRVMDYMASWYSSEIAGGVAV